METLKNTSDTSGPLPDLQRSASGNSATQRLLRFNTESCSDTSSHHYGFPDTPEAESSGQSSSDGQRLSRLGSGAATSATRRTIWSSQSDMGEARQHAAHSVRSAAGNGNPDDLEAAQPATPSGADMPAGLRPIAVRADEATPAVAARVFHNLFRLPQATGQTSLLAESLVPGQAARSDAGSDVASRPLMSRSASHRALTDFERDGAAQNWERLRNLFIAWLLASLLTIIVSWWWFGLGILAGGLGVLGSISGLRHKGTTPDLVQPAKGVQLLGVLSSLVSLAAVGVFIVAQVAIRCPDGMDCARLRVMLAVVTSWFCIELCTSTLCAYQSYRIIQRLQPTFYMRQSEVAIPEAHDLGIGVQFTPTPRARSRPLEFPIDSPVPNLRID